MVLQRIHALVFLYQFHISVKHIHLCQLSHIFLFTVLYTLVWISDTSEPESNKAWNFHLFIFIMHEFGLPASSTLNVGTSLSNLLSPLASTWIECTSFPGSCFSDLGSWSSLYVLLILVSTVLFKWPTSLHHQQWLSSVSGSLTCAFTLTGLDLQ